MPLFDLMNIAGSFRARMTRPDQISPSSGLRKMTALNAYLRRREINRQGARPAKPD